MTRAETLNNMLCVHVWPVGSEVRVSCGVGGQSSPELRAGQGWQGSPKPWSGEAQQHSDLVTAPGKGLEHVPILMAP